ncbi:MAG: hypothetical protein FWF25_02230 [Propionibacteriaceae bacterium]|nr:hypothetical protein [Propionibacteriaceae bacterium]
MDRTTYHLLVTTIYLIIGSIILAIAHSDLSRVLGGIGLVIALILTLVLPSVISKGSHKTDEASSPFSSPIPPQPPSPDVYAPAQYEEYPEQKETTNQTISLDGDTTRPGSQPPASQRIPKSQLPWLVGASAGLVCIILVVVIIMHMSPSDAIDTPPLPALPSSSATQTDDTPSINLLPASFLYNIHDLPAGSTIGTATFPAMQPGWSKTVIQGSCDAPGVQRDFVLENYSVVHDDCGSEPTIGQPGVTLLSAWVNAEGNPEGPEPFTLLDQKVLPQFQNPTGSPLVFFFQSPTGVTYQYQIQERAIVTAAGNHPVFSENSGRAQLGSDGKSIPAGNGNFFLDIEQANPTAGLIALYSDFPVTIDNIATEEFIEKLVIVYVGQLVGATSEGGAPVDVKNAAEYVPQSYSLPAPK